MNLTDSTSFAAVKAPLDLARHAPGYIYDSEEVLEIEKQEVFLKDWLCVARVEEFQKPGDYQTFEILNEKVLIALGNDGKHYASLNMCAHRGVAVAHGSGNVDKFRCPYHAWTYDLTGQLTHTPYMRESREFDISKCRLPKISLDTWAGWIFINFSPNPAPLSETIAAFDDAFSLLRQEDCRLAFKLVNDWDCNWKYVVENLMDLYHVGAIHMATFGKTIKTNEFPFHLKRNGGFTTFVEGRPLTPDGKSRLGPLPWLADKPETFACYGYTAPNLMLLARQDFVRPTVIWPMGPRKSRSISYFLLAPEQMALPDLDSRLRVYTDFIRQIVEEDRPLVQALQHVSRSRFFKPGRLSVLESAIHHMVNHHLNRIEGPLREAGITR